MIVRCTTPTGFEVDINPEWSPQLVDILMLSDVTAVTIHREIGDFHYKNVEDEDEQAFGGP